MEYLKHQLLEFIKDLNINDKFQLIIIYLLLTLIKKNQVGVLLLLKI